MAKHQMVLVYEILEKTIYPYAFGVYENFYRDLKEYRSWTGSEDSMRMDKKR